MSGKMQNAPFFTSSSAAYKKFHGLNVGVVTFADESAPRLRAQTNRSAFEYLG